MSQGIDPYDMEARITILEEDVAELKTFIAQFMPLGPRPDNREVRDLEVERITAMSKKILDQTGTAITEK